MLFRISRALAWVALITVASTTFLPHLALAQATGGFKSGFDKVEAARAAAGIRNFGTLSNFIIAVLAVVTALVAVIALAALIFGAVLYIISLGDEGKTEKAKKIILYALIGLLVLGGAGILVNVVINLISK